MPSQLRLAVLIAFIPTSICIAGDTAVEARHGMVVSVSPHASRVGVEILKKGGNAVDAAIATAFALAVTFPEAGNIGGGGFMLVHPPKGKPVVIEYRETAPAAANRKMFAKQSDTYTHNAVGVPGTIRGLALAHEKFGRLPWKDLLGPAIQLAENGFALDARTARSLNLITAISKNFPEFVRVYGKNAGKATWAEGDRMVLPDLAKTLRLIAEGGPDAFYKGPIAEQIVAEMKSGGGLIGKEDLANYRAHIRPPVHGTYREYDAYAPPLPSGGGICLVEMLNILENFELKPADRMTPRSIHLMTEAMRRAYCDRARYLGDPDFAKIPNHLTSKDYAKELAKTISLDKATPSEQLAKNIPLTPESNDTTHFSIIDMDGLAVANTYTLEHSFGSKIVVRGAGFLLNNEMSDFNWKPGVTDRKGRIGTEPNVVAPGKRMLSSQTPTIVSRNGRPLLVTGSPGSRTITNTVLCIIVNVIDFGMNIRDAVDSPRIHHQWFPDEIKMEHSQDNPELVEALRKLGHKVIESKQGDGHSIWIDPKTGIYYGAADHRLIGSAKGY